MRNPFVKALSPGLARELAGMRFESPIALEPALSFNRRWIGSGDGRFAFEEIGPIDSEQMEQRVRLKRPSALRHALNITHSGLKTAEDLFRENVDAFARMYDYSGLFVLDTFRPDASGALPLQNADTLSEMLDRMMDIRRFYGGDKALLVRISPMVAERELAGMLHVIRMSDADAVIAGVNRFCPELLQRIRHYTADRFPIIGCGGVNTFSKAKELLDSGATIVQAQRMTAGIILKQLQRQQTEKA